VLLLVVVGVSILLVFRGYFWGAGRSLMADQCATPAPWPRRRVFSPAGGLARCRVPLPLAGCGYPRGGRFPAWWNAGARPATLARYLL